MRKDNVKAYHSIIAFSNKETTLINDEMLKDISDKFVSLWGANALYVGAVHRNTDSIHIHIVSSGTQLCTGLANRKSTQQFQELKVKLQEYQKEKYPQLIHSLPEH